MNCGRDVREKRFTRATCIRAYITPQVGKNIVQYMQRQDLEPYSRRAGTFQEGASFLFLPHFLADS
jgi:DNA topoisomerase IB